MNQSNAQKPQATDGDRAMSARELADYQRRLRAAGLDAGSDRAGDIDAIRNGIARRIHMYLNTWHGCPERLCRRNRGCMAPDNRCANVERLPPEEADRRWREVQPRIYKALKEHLAAHGVGDE